jgi:hypothetical protein
MNFYRGVEEISVLNFFNFFDLAVNFFFLAAGACARDWSGNPFLPRSGKKDCSGKPGFFVRLRTKKRARMS